VLYSTGFETDQSTMWLEDSPVGSGIGFGDVDLSHAFANLDGRTGTALKVSVKTASSPSGSSGYSVTLDVADALGGVPLSGGYRVNFDVFTSYAAPPGTGTSDYATYSINRAAGSAPNAFAAPNSGLTMLRSADGDLGTSGDYRVYSPDANDILTLRQGIDVPTGSVGLRWEAVELRFDGTALEWYQNGSLITTYVNDSDTSGSITLGYYDTGGGSSADPTQQFALFDNLVVSVPEPGALGLVSIGALTLLRRRRA
jgi:hypothetical protein